MPKVATLLAAIVAGTFCYTSAQASVGPLLPSSDSASASDLPSEISAASSFADTRLEVGGELGIIVPHRSPTLHPLTVPHLALGPTAAHTTVYTEFAVGRGDLGPFQPERPNTFAWRAPASTHFAAESAFIRSLVVGQDFLDALCERFDLQDDDERPWSTTTTVHLLYSTNDPIVPFATLAYEEDSLEINDRIGLGGGLEFKFNRNTSLGGEAIYFADHPNDSLPRETRFLAKFEIDF